MVAGLEFKERDKRLASMARVYQDCRLCELCKIRKEFVFGSGSTELGLMVIGEAPGKMENKLGVPFVGPSGAIIRRAINKVVPVGKVYLANMVCCWPGPAIKTPTTEHLIQCQPRLIAQVVIARPKAILLVGKIAEFLMTTQPHHDFLEVYSAPLKKSHRCRIFRVVHPAYLLRKGSEKSKDYPEFLGGIEQAIKFCMRKRAIAVK